MVETKPVLLVLSSTYPRRPGDSEPAFVHELSRRLARSYDVTVLAPHARGLSGRERMDGVEVRRYRYLPERCERLAYDGGIPAKLRGRPWLWLQVPFLIGALLAATWRACAERRVDVIHAHWIVPQGLAAALAGRLTRRPALVCTAHGADLYAHQRGAMRWLKSWTLQRMDALTVVSRAMVDAASALGAARTAVTVAPMGVDVSERFVPPKAATRKASMVLFVGRLVEKKGVRTLLHAFSEVRGRRPQATLVIAGDGPDRPALEAESRALELGDSVRFAGAMPQGELVSLYQSAAVAAFPFQVAADGDREGLGLVAVEAQACACPVIAGDVPAVRDVVEDGVSGLLVTPGSSGSLARAILRVLSDPGLAARLGANGRRSAVERFDWTRAAARYLEILEDARRRHARGQPVR